jgi:hypothetical protein
MGPQMNFFGGQSLTRTVALVGVLVLLVSGSVALDCTARSARRDRRHASRRSLPPAELLLRDGLVEVVSVFGQKSVGVVCDAATIDDSTDGRVPVHVTRFPVLVVDGLPVLGAVVVVLSVPESLDRSQVVQRDTAELLIAELAPRGWAGAVAGIVDIGGHATRGRGGGNSDGVAINLHA